MPIVKLREGPIDGTSIIGRALHDLRSSSLSRDSLGGASVDLTQPLPVYRLGLHEIYGKESLVQAAFVGWRYLVDDNGNKAYADITNASSGGHVFATFAQNRNADRLNDAAHLAEMVAENMANCEARILDLPAIHISAVWLAGPDPKFIPYIDPELLATPDAKISVDDDFFDRIRVRAEFMRTHLSNEQNNTQAG